MNQAQVEIVENMRKLSVQMDVLLHENGAAGATRVEVTVLENQILELATESGLSRAALELIVSDPHPKNIDLSIEYDLARTEDSLIQLHNQYVQELIQAGYIEA